LITGEKGTGKDLVAQAIHFHSSKSNSGLAKINCGLLAKDLSVKGLFGLLEIRLPQPNLGNGALFRSANGTTLFFDEFEGLPDPFQIELRRILEGNPSKETKDICGKIKTMRLVFSTRTTVNKKNMNAILRDLLLHRLDVLKVELPPLRDRKADIPSLARFMIQRSHAQFMKNHFRIPEEILNLFYAYLWPGNVKELEIVIHRAIATGKWTLLNQRLC
jgi:DNA-binding NtrC family response regulator